MGDLISDSPGREVGDGDAPEMAVEAVASGAAYVIVWGSSACEIEAPPFGPRLSFILKSCFSISNSEMEFFFIRSMIALMSFRSTKLSAISVQRPRLRASKRLDSCDPTAATNPKTASVFVLMGATIDPR